MPKTNTTPSPCYVLDESALIGNLNLIQQVAIQSGTKIILAFKGFALWACFPTVKQYLKGAAASSMHEVLLCNETMNCKAHTYAVAYKATEIDSILDGSSHITFNSVGQLKQYYDKAKEANVSIGLRVNPEYSDVETALYNPALPTSRLGVPSEQIAREKLPDIDGLHFHVLCESDSFALEKALKALEQKFGSLLSQVKWLNVGGGHLITRKGYDTKHLIKILKDFREKYDLNIILEPGSAIAWDTGSLHVTVLDIVENGGIKTAVIDASITCHMPDCLEMPYRPEIKSAHQDASAKSYAYRIGGSSCLAGDFLAEYSFDKPLEIGDQLEFIDMMHYTMVKTTTFNGIQHPAIAIRNTKGKVVVIREFGYADYKNKLS